MSTIDSFRGMRILVVGANGFLGQPLTNRLAASGAILCAFCRSPPDLGVKANDIHWWRGDAADANCVDRVFRSFRPEIVFHLASNSQGGRSLELIPGSLQNDVVAAVNVLHAAASAVTKVERFIMTGSFEEPDHGEPTPVSPYAAAKWAASGYGRMFRQHYGLDVRIVRPMMTFGPGQKEIKFMPSTIWSLLRNQRTYIGSGSRLVDWVYVNDVVDGLMIAARVAEMPSAVDLGTGKLVSVGDVARELGRQLGRAHLLTIGDGWRGAEVVRAGDVAVARQLLGFAAKTSLLEGLTRTIAFYKGEFRSRHDTQQARPRVASFPYATD